jgi:hypothetical protein
MFMTDINIIMGATPPIQEYWLPVILIKVLGLTGNFHPKLALASLNVTKKNTLSAEYILLTP